MMDGSCRQLLGSCQGKAGEGPSGTHVRRGVRNPWAGWECGRGQGPTFSSSSVSLVGPAGVRMRGDLAGESAPQLILKHSLCCQFLARPETRKDSILLFN